MKRDRRAEHLDEVAESVFAGSRALIAIAARSMPDSDEVTLAQYRALVVLTSHGPLTAGRLSELLDVHPSTTTRLVDRLLSNRFIKRSTTSDRREVVITLEPAAIRLLEAVTSDRLRQIRSIIARLSPDEADNVVTAFRAFSEAAGEIPDSRWSALLDAPAEPYPQTTEPT